MGRSSRSPGLIGQFPTSAQQFFQAYAESVSAVDFLIRDPRPGCARLAHPLVCRRAHRRRGVHGRDRHGHGRLRRGLDGRPGGEDAGPLRTAACCGGPGTRCLGGRWRSDRQRGPWRPARPVDRCRAPAPPARPGLPWPPRPTMAVPPPSSSSPCWPSCSWRSSRGWCAGEVERNQRHDPDGAPPVHPELATDTGGGVAGAGIPRGRPAGRPGPSCPLHDPGADAARRDRDGVADAAGAAQGSHPGPARAHPGNGAGGGGVSRARARPQRPAAVRPHRRRPHPAPGDRASCSSSRIRWSRWRRMPTRRITSSGRGTSGRWSRSSGARAPRRSRSTGSGSRRRARSSISARRSW